MSEDHGRESKGGRRGGGGESKKQQLWTHRSIGSIISSSIRGSRLKKRIGRSSSRAKPHSNASLITTTTSTSASASASASSACCCSAITTPRVVPSDLPLVLWMDGIFPFLNRSSQNKLAEAHPDVAKARRRRCRLIGVVQDPSSSTNTPCTTIMDWPSGRLAKKFPRPVKHVLFSPNDDSSSTLWITYCKSKIAHYNILAGPNMPPLLDNDGQHSGIVADIQYSPCDGTMLATASKNDGTIRLWRKQQQQQQQQQQEQHWTCFRVLQIHQSDLRYMSWSPKGDKIVAWGYDGFVRVIMDIRTGRMQSCFWKTRIEVAGCHKCVAFDPLGSSVLFAQDHDHVLEWNLQTNETRILPQVRDEHGSHAGNFVTGLTFSPDGTLLVVGCHVATILFWRVSIVGQHDDDDDAGATAADEETTTETQQQQQQVQYDFGGKMHAGSGWSAVSLLTFTADGKYLACTNSGSQIRIINVATRQVVTTLTGHTGPIESLSFTANGKTLASGSCDRTVRLWDTSEWCCPTRTP